MDRTQLRLEILKIVAPVTAHQGPDNITATARHLEHFVLEPETEPGGEGTQTSATEAPTEETTEKSSASTSGKRKATEGNPFEN